jgi:hypothetical protein
MMNDPSDKNLDERLSAYLDGQMNEPERMAFERSLRNDAARLREVELDARIEASLERMFAVAEPTDDHISSLFARDPSAVSTLPAHPASSDASVVATQPTSCGELQGSLSYRVPRLAWTAAVLAASIGLVAVAWWIGVAGEHAEPYFEPTPVAQLYRETVKDGFEPYYECREADRFATTFLRRQGKPLQLLPLPSGSRMLGLSYPGGLSRDTTAMLCIVDDRPVMVFVDRLARDLSLARENSDPSISIFREARDGLVFYEVTPLGVARVTEYLSLGKTPVPK